MKFLPSLVMKVFCFTLTMREGMLLFTVNWLVRFFFSFNPTTYICLCHRFGRHSYDEMSILAPLTQCCMYVFPVQLQHIHFTFINNYWEKGVKENPLEVSMAQFWQTAKKKKRNNFLVLAKIFFDTSTSNLNFWHLIFKNTNIKCLIEYNYFHYKYINNLREK